MNLKKYPLLGLVFLSFFIFSGCAKKEGVKPEKVTLRFANWEVTPEQLSLWQEVVKKFNQTHPDIHIKFEPVSGGTQPIIVQIAGGMAPDIFYWCTPTILSPLVKKEAVLNLSPYIEKSGINPEDYFSVAWEASKFEGKIYGMPVYWGTTAIAYNKDIFDKEGVPYPPPDWTWKDFLELAKKLTRRKNGKVLQYGCTPPRGIITFFGGSWFNEEGEFTGDSPEVKEALRFLQEVRYKYKVSPSLASLPPDYYRGEIELFLTGKVAMFAVESWAISVLKKIKEFRWDVAPLPRKKGKKRVVPEGAGVLCISTQSKYPQKAWEFVKFSASEGGQKILARGGNNIPALKKVARTHFLPPPANIKVFITQIEEVAFCPGRFPWYREWEMEILHSEMDKLLLNKQTVERTIEILRKKTETFLEKKR